MAVNEKYTNPDKTKQNPWFSHYLTVSKRSKSNYIWQTTNYFQVQCRKLSTYRVLSESKLTIKMSTDLNIISTVQFKYSSIVHAQNEHYDIDFKQGVNYQF